MTRKSWIEYKNYFWASGWFIFFFLLLPSFLFLVKIPKTGLMHEFFENELIKIIYIPFFLFIISFAIVRCFIKPYIYISVGHIDTGTIVNKEVRFLHFKVINLDWPSFFFFFRRNSANNTLAKISIKKRNSSDTPKEMIGRWSIRAEPQSITDVITATNKQVALSSSKNLNEIKEGILDVVVVVKDKDKKKFNLFLFNDLNYSSKQEDFPKFKDHILEKQDYELEVNITGNQSAAASKFILTGMDDFYNVRLEEVA